MASVAEKLAELMYMPQWLGYPFYPNSLPMFPDSIGINTGNGSLSVQDRIDLYYQTCISDEGKLLENPPLGADELEVLRQWVIYYLHAPIWDRAASDDLVVCREKSFAIATWQDLNDVAHDALDMGLDIL